jgi:hypothetical protein
MPGHSPTHSTHIHRHTQAHTHRERETEKERERERQTEGGDKDYISPNRTSYSNEAPSHCDHSQQNHSRQQQAISRSYIAPPHKMHHNTRAPEHTPPVGVGDGEGGGDFLKLLHRPVPEGTARCGQDDPSQAAFWQTLEALEDSLPTQQART